ncbi:hypothetical protein SULI_04665 [Saccharolobus solfataricus]|nr:hypothetical protein SULB_0953 [Saccharolobus solfataricus]AKA75999.1 hypothetical protein SULC_0952 [Saccharolobus solfataricus]AKA78692.1 hypothetical protein SULA_0951 [Saccharolobus solfataricus]AZF67767.1 hypothetical protein SULG_04665 [Saccharolobus solfataricus]AZF70387.1 hypothetical protein SULH_04665 [Saccharolobus solfataricus]
MFQNIFIHKMRVFIMAVEFNEKGVTIKIPTLSTSISFSKDQIEKVEEVVPPDEICRFARNSGVIFAGSTIDGKVMYFNVKKGERCLLLVLKDGRKVYIGT